MATAKDTKRTKGGVVYLSTTMQVPIVPMSIYGLKDVIWSYIGRGVRPKVLVSFGLLPSSNFRLWSTV